MESYVWPCLAVVTTTNSTVYKATKSLIVQLALPGISNGDIQGFYLPPPPPTIKLFLKKVLLESQPRYGERCK